MYKPTILVTAASGKTGTATTRQLLARGYPVRAMVRRDDDRARSLREAGAEVTVGSLEDLTDLTTNLTGVQRAYFCPPLEPGTLRRAALFATAAQQSRLEVVVALSQWVADPLHPAVHAREKWLTNQVLHSISTADLVVVNPGWFADNYLAALEAAAQFGLLAMPLGQGLNAPPSNEDIARVIVGALTDPAPHLGKTYRPTGPRLLAPDDIAAAFAAALNRKVKYRDAPLPLFLKVAKSLGLSDFVISQLYWFLQDYQSNAFGLGAPTDAVLEVGGSPPEPFDQIVRRYARSSPVTAHTASAKLRAAAHLVRALLTRAPNLDALARQGMNPPLDHSALAVDSPTWLDSHDPSARPDDEGGEQTDHPSLRQQRKRQ
ncbi:NAD(P)H-binding protein [Nocardia sp. NPDC046763]|uniref:NmrA family NAD(P)-binding protein n=1 Tax=Nocardia sp. NPDC046763 TaxID=3155256 RepID=UPI0033C620A1